MNDRLIWPPDDEITFVLARASTATATHTGSRSANADAVHVEHSPLGIGAAVIDGIGSAPEVCTAARRAADHAAIIASHRGAQAGLLAAAALYPDYESSPNAVGAVVSVDPDGDVEVAHVGDAAVYTWTPAEGLTCWTPGITVAAHVRRMLDNPNLSDADRAALGRLGGAVEIMDAYVLTTLVQADPHTISWTPVRHRQGRPHLVLVLSDGVHKQIGGEMLRSLVEAYHRTPQDLADALVHRATTTPRSDNATAAVLRLTHDRAE